MQVVQRCLQAFHDLDELGLHRDPLKHWECSEASRDMPYTLANVYFGDILFWASRMRARFRVGIATTSRIARLIESQTKQGAEFACAPCESRLLYPAQVELLSIGQRPGHPQK